MIKPIYIEKQITTIIWGIYGRSEYISKGEIKIKGKILDELKRNNIAIYFWRKYIQPKIALSSSTVTIQFQGK